jgi:hypothetical protein
MKSIEKSELTKVPTIFPNILVDTIYFRNLNENDKRILRSNGVSIEGQVLDLK